MIGYCAQHGKPLLPDGGCRECESGSRELPEAWPQEQHAAPRPTAEIGPQLRKARVLRRLLGSGVEFTCYATGVWAVTVLDLTGLLGLLTVVIAGLVILRDFNGGAFSISKRVSQMRVVNWRTGRPASNPQALLRNSYYLALPVVAILPLIDCFTSWLFMMFIALDLMMIVASRQGRRLGDLLAGTQVVDVEARV